MTIRFLPFLPFLPFAALAIVACETPPVDVGEGEGEGEGDAGFTFTLVLWSDDDGPSDREHGAMVIDDDGTAVFVIGGGGYPNFPVQPLLDDAWRFDIATSTWTTWPLSGDVPPPAASRRVARLPNNRAILFGGYVADFLSIDEAYLIDLVAGTSTRLEQENTPPARSLHAFGYDAATAQLVTFGGFFADAQTQNILNDTWTATLTLEDAVQLRWLEVDGPAPPARYGMFTDIDAGQLVVFSGAGFPTQQDPINASDDVWRFDVGARSWSQTTTTGETVSGRRNGCGIIDRVSHNLFVFGGTANGRTTEPGSWLLSADGVWLPGPADDEPPLRSSAFGAALPDVIGGGVVCGFGNDADTYRDLFFLQN